MTWESRREEKRRRMSRPPQRLPDGRVRCEWGGSFDDERHCPKAAEWIHQGATITSPGAVLCDEHRQESDRKFTPPRVLWVTLDNPPATPERAP